MAKQSQVKSRRKLLNPIFHLQTKDEDDSQLTKGMIKIVRKTGQLNLSGRSLATVPNRMFSMYDIEEEKNFDFSKPADEPWWSFSPLIYLDLSSNILQKLPPAIKIFEDLAVLNSLLILHLGGHDQTIERAEMCLEQGGMHFENLIQKCYNIQFKNSKPEPFSLQDNCLMELPTEIGNLTKLTKLNVSRNKLTTLPKELYKLTELKQLLIAYNNLELLTDDIADLVMLEQLDVSHNNLITLRPGLGFLVRLREINVSYNTLIDIPPEITGLRILSKLDVTHNNLKCLPKICEMRKLQFLYAQHNNIEELPDFSGCESLQQLHLGNNFIKKIDKDFFENMTHLKILDLRDNKITNLPDEVAMCQNIIRLDLTNNALETLPNSLGLLPHLQNLQVEGNKLKQIRSDIIKGGTWRITKHLREKFDAECNLSEYHQIKENHPLVNVYSFPDRYVMSHCRSLSLGLQNLSVVPDSVFEDAKTAEITVVDLCKNKFSSVPEGLKVVAHQITELNLSSNQLKVIPEFISECIKLQFLDVGKNFLSGLPNGLHCLKWMREIVIANNRFKAIPECIYELESLEILNAADNQIFEINVNGLTQLKKLATLQLSNNNINYVPPELGNVKQLRCLDLMGNSFRQPRYAILEQGSESILSYLRDRIPQ